MEKIKKHTILKKSQVGEFRKDLTKDMLFLLLLCAIQWGLALIGKLLGLSEHKEFFGTVYLIYCGISIFLIYRKGKNYILDNEIKKEKMTGISFLKHFSCMITLMIVATIPTVIMDMILQSCGYTLINLASANEFSNSITEFLYVAFMGPICEEIIFRGLIQKDMEKYSPVIAIIISAFTFGLYHGNFSQIFPMMGVGLALGYVAYKYSIKWSIVIHITYNLCMGELFGLLSEHLKNGEEEYVLPIINKTPFMFTVMVFAIIGIIFLSKMLLTNKIPFSNYRIKMKKIILILTSSGMVTFMIYNLITAILLIGKL